MKKYKNLILSGVAASLLLIGCGGGGGSSSSSNVTGTVEASYLKGVNVCVKGTDNCVKTDSNGQFTLSGVKAPVELEIKIGNSVLADLNVSSNNYRITPAVLGDNNSTVASYIGAMLHGIAGCGLTSQRCDFSNVTNVDVNNSSNLPIINEVKQILEHNSSADINITVDGNNVQISESNTTLYATANPTMTGVTNYRFNGAARAGDYATFTYDSENSTITYHIKGNVYGNKSNTREIENLYGNVFFKDKNKSDVFYFFSGSLGVAIIPDVNESNASQTAFVVGMQQPDKNLTAADLDLIANKRFNYMEFDTDGSIYFGVIDINSTNTSDLNGTWVDYVDNTNGRWEVNGSHLDVFDSNGKIANIVIRAGTSRSGIVVDNVDGGFGIGIEAKELTASDLRGTYYYFDSDSDGTECYGKTTISADNNGSFSYQDTWCTDTDDIDSGSGTLVLNPTVIINRREVNLTGIAQVRDEDGNLTNEFVFIDPDDGYYVSIDRSNGDISIGSNKPLK